MIASVAAIGVIAFGGGSSSAAALTLEPAASPGADPFTTSVAVGPAVEFPGRVRAATAGIRKRLPVNLITHTRVAVGVRPGLYGGSGDTHVCNSKQLVDFLVANPAQAAAWAGVLGVPATGITGYVATLTPVVLMFDTRVTNHGYHDGRATTLQSVLQAGTAVMVDRTGTPRVKCNCGNPLTPPEPISGTSTSGTPWHGYTTDGMITVKPGPPTSTLTLINTTTGDNYRQPTGTASAGTTARGRWIAAEIADQAASTTIVSSTDGHAWSRAAVIPDAAVQGLAWGKGKWVAITDYRYADGAHVLASTDLRAWKQVASLGPVFGIAFGAGRWIAIGGTQGDTPPFHVMYTSTDAIHWNRIPADFDGLLGTGHGLLSIGYGNGKWTAVGGGGALESAGTFSTLESDDGFTWRVAMPRLSDNAFNGRVAYGDGHWVIGSNKPSDLRGTQRFADGGIDISNGGGRAWQPVATGRLLRHNGLVAVGYGNGAWLAVGASQDQPFGFHGIPSSTFFASSDGRRWSRVGHVNESVSTMAFGGTSAAAPAAGATTATTQPITEPTVVPTTRPAPPTTVARASNVPDIRKTDFRNYSYVDQVCSKKQLVRFVNGEWMDPDDSFHMCGESIVSVDFADITGDGHDDAIVSIVGSAGGTALSLVASTTAFAATPTGPRNLGYFGGSAFPPYSPSLGVSTWERLLQPGDRTCCPSTYTVRTLKYGGEKLAVTATRIAPASQLPKR